MLSKSVPGEVPQRFINGLHQSARRETAFGILQIAVAKATIFGSF